MDRRRLVIWCLVLALSAAGCPAAAASSQPLQMHTALACGSCKPRSVAMLSSGLFLFTDELNDLVEQALPGGSPTILAGNIDLTTGLPDTTDVNGVPATTSGLNDPVSVAPLPDGGFLITEFDGAAVRMVPGASGTYFGQAMQAGDIYTIAGTGTPGFNGDGISGAAAELNYPTDATPTPDGGVLIADTFNNRVRYLAPDGKISTVAGGGACDDTVAGACAGLSAISVELHHPDSVAVLSSGSGYLIAEADYNVSAVREISSLTASGQFSTVAGVPGADGGFGGDNGPATEALLNGPEQVIALSGGSFVIADTGNDRIREVSPTGTITTLAGNGLAAYAGDGGNATSASMQNPSGVSATSEGGFVVADTDDSAIREITVPPITTVVLPRPGLGRNGWYRHPISPAITSNEEGTVNCALDLGYVPPVFQAIPPGCLYWQATGAEIAQNGSHTLYVASQNLAGDDELPVLRITIKIDTTRPVIRCGRYNIFPLGERRALAQATVSDRYSGPERPTVYARAHTRKPGQFVATLRGSNQAGATRVTSCPYTVLPPTLRPSPALQSAFSPGRRSTGLRRLVVSRVPSQATVAVICRGKGCPFSAARDTNGQLCGNHPCQAQPLSGGRPRTVNLIHLFKQVRLPAGAHLTVTITQPHHLGRAWVFDIVAGAHPTVTDTCTLSVQRSPGVGCAIPGRAPL